jgi:hypothetical protein
MALNKQPFEKSLPPSPKHLFHPLSKGKGKEKYPISLQKSLCWKGGEENCFGEGKFLGKGRN